MIITDLTTGMCDVLSSIGDRQASATEMGVNGYVMKRLWEMGFLKMDLPGKGEFPPVYSLSERGLGAATILTTRPVRYNPEGPVARIKRVVCDHYHIPDSEMVSARRARKVSRPRQVAMYLAKRLTPKSLPDIGRHFDRDHTTVLHAVRKIEQLMMDDERFKDEVRTIKEQIVSTDIGGKCAKDSCQQSPNDPLEWSMRYINQIADPSARKTVIMSKWERGELTAEEASKLIRTNKLESA